MNINRETLRHIRSYRANHDPVIPHQQSQDWLSSALNGLENDIVTCRHEQLESAPIDKPIECVTWPELAVWCQTASMDATMVGDDFLGIYQYSLKQLLDTTQSQSAASILPSNFGQKSPITDRHQDLAEKQRATLKQIQDELFTRSLYDEIEFDTSGVPKAFWKQNITDPSVHKSNKDTESNRSNSSSQQIGLDMY